MTGIGIPHILFFTDNFPPEVNAPASRTFEHCREWVKENCSVTVITCFPNFPIGKIHSGYENKFFLIEELEGIRVIRVKTFIAANEGTVLRTLDYISFMLSSLVAAFFVRKVDLIIGTSPQFFAVVAAFITGMLKRVPWVFELRDLWPESIRALDVVKGESANKIINLLEKLELFLYRRSEAIICVTESFRLNLISRSIPPEKIHVITNGVDLEFFQACETKDKYLQNQFHLNNKFVAGYMGTIGLAHSIGTLLEAAKKLQGMKDARDIVIMIVGDGANKKKILQQKMQLGLNNTIILDTVPKAAVPAYLNLFDVSIIHLAAKDLFKTVIPSKLFESMAMGIPVIYGVEGESREIVSRNKLGLMFQPENSNELAEKLVEIKRSRTDLLNFRKNSIKASSKYSRKNLSLRMLSVFRVLLNKRNRSQKV